MWWMHLVRHVDRPPNYSVLNRSRVKCIFSTTPSVASHASDLWHYHLVLEWWHLPQLMICLQLSQDTGRTLWSS